MPNYGLPLIFKAVNVETGEEWEGDYPYMVYSGTKKHKIRLTPHHANIALLQQTGFTDAAGKGVYFGDVLALMYSNGKGIKLLIVNVDHNYGSISARATDGSALIHSDRFGSSCYIVGNAYEPPARWLERAREIWPDAVLPEGDKCL